MDQDRAAFPMSEPNGRWPIQNIFYSITLIVTVCGVMLGAYWNVLQTINAQQVTIAGIEARLVVTEKLLQSRQDAEDRFSGEMRAALASISQGVADLRVQIALEQRGKK